MEFQAEDGTRYTLAVEGRLSREKVMKVMDLMELVDGDQGKFEPTIDNSTVFGKVLKVIDESFPSKEFSSADVARDYEELHAETIRLSTIATYLSRFVDRGLLKRQKFGNSWVYKRNYLPHDQLPVR